MKFQFFNKTIENIENSKGMTKMSLILPSFILTEDEQHNNPNVFEGSI